MNGFQMTIIGFFIIALIVGVLVFAGVLPGFRAPEGGTGGLVVWWGTIPEDSLGEILNQISREHDGDFTLQYVEKNPETIENDLVEALALGRGPDLVTLSSDQLLRQEAKLQPIPYSSISRQSFKDTFVLGTSLKDWELMFGPSGVIGLPIYVDPLVLYYNQDLLTNAKLPLVPRLWKDLAPAIKLLTQTDGRGNINQAAIAIGSFSNIVHAKELLSLLFLQAGNPIVARGDGFPTVTLKDSLGFNKAPAGEAVAFFLRFTDSANTLYSWNSSQPEAREAFLRGRLALYFGFGSELPRLAVQNPQLNFYLTLPPQREAGSRQITLGRFYFLGIPLGSKNPATAYLVSTLLTGNKFGGMISSAIGLPPARNDLLANAPSDPNLAVLYQAAILARDWLDPDPSKTQAIFRRLAESIALGQVDADRAISNADIELENLLPRQDASISN